MTSSSKHESSSVQRLTRGRAVGSSEGTATSSRPVGTSDEFDLQSRPEFENVCLEALEDFRRGRVDKTSTTTRIAVAIAGACLPDVEESRTFDRYFSFVDRDEHELRRAGSQTRLDHADNRDAEEKDVARQVCGGRDEEDRVTETHSEAPSSVKRRKYRRSVVNGRHDGRRSNATSNRPSCDTGDDESDTIEEYSNSDTSSRSSIESSVATTRRKKVKLDLRYLERASKSDETKGISKQLRRTNRMLDNWSQDFKEVVRRFNVCASRPEFPLTELKNILGGRYVNLDSVITYHYSSNSPEKHTEKIGELEFSFAPSTFARSVESAPDWITAWGRTERAYRFVFPFRVDEFRQYGEYISQMFTQHQPEFHFRVIQFDKAIRKRVGAFVDACLETVPVSDVSPISAIHISIPPIDQQRSTASNIMGSSSCTHDP